jgi:glutathione S-transferase
MKLYDCSGAPNPRRVTIFVAEKGLELDDGRCIAESVAICRYLEAIQPEAKAASDQKVNQYYERLYRWHGEVSDRPSCKAGNSS